MLYIIISVDDNNMITEITIQIIENKNKLLNNKNK